MRNLLLILLLSFVIVNSQTIKFATLAPEGTTWMNVMREFAEAVTSETNGKVKFKIYPSSVQGDDKDVLRKIRINQLHSAGFTGVGLGEIFPEVRILDTPFLFRNNDELDYIKTKFLKRFADGFEKKGFILLGWAEVGFVYFFTNEPIQTKDDFQGIKMWMWEGDPVAEATFKAFGLSPIPLSVVDVLTSLQTGLVDGVYTSPLACISMQWFTKTKYILDLPLANASGAVLLSKWMYNKLSNEDQKIIRAKGREYFEKLVKLSREDNEKSMEAILSSGITQIEPPSKEIISKYEAIGREARYDLVGKLYDQTLLNDIETALQDYRNSVSKAE
jgi:TRAP-type C4-dicarboxylate transport system substrate-binding protein